MRYRGRRYSRGARYLVITPRREMVTLRYKGQVVLNGETVLLFTAGRARRTR
jgi:hypothetical protein